MRKSIVCVLVVLSFAARAEANDPAESVVGGTQVPEGKWRDVVLVVGREARCTGTLVAPDVVLTAGHCIDIDPVEVRTDTVDFGRPGGDRIPIKWARAYPNWEDRYDVGVIVLDHVARGRPRKIAAACAARRGLVAGEKVHLVGFGATTPEGEDDNSELREAEVSIVDPTCTTDRACQAAIAPHGEFTAAGTADACFGDSGGPVYLETEDGPALVGVVSRGLALPGPPCGPGGVYVRADKVVSWVQSVTGTRLERTGCDGPADGEDVEVEDGGCSVGGSAGVGWWLVVAGIAVLRRPRSSRRRFASSVRT